MSCAFDSKRQSWHWCVWSMQVDKSLADALEGLRLRKEIATLTPQHSREINSWYQGMKVKTGKTLASLQVYHYSFNINTTSRHGPKALRAVTAWPSPNFHGASPMPWWQFNFSEMRRPCKWHACTALYLHSLKHDVAYSLSPAVHFRVVMFTAVCTVVSSFSNVDTARCYLLVSGDFYLRQGWRKMQDHCSLVIILYKKAQLTHREARNSLGI